MFLFLWQFFIPLVVFLMPFLKITEVADIFSLTSRDPIFPPLFLSRSTHFEDVANSDVILAVFAKRFSFL